MEYLCSPFVSSLSEAFAEETPCLNAWRKVAETLCSLVEVSGMCRKSLLISIQLHSGGLERYCGNVHATIVRTPRLPNPREKKLTDLKHSRSQQRITTNSDKDVLHQSQDIQLIWRRIVVLHLSWKEAIESENFDSAEWSRFLSYLKVILEKYDRSSRVHNRFPPIHDRIWSVNVGHVNIYIPQQSPFICCYECTQRLFWMDEQVGTDTVQFRF